MGATFGMRNIRIVIPVAVTLAAVIIFSIIAGCHRNKIRSVVNSAGKNGFPIVVTYSPYDSRLSPYSLFSLDSDPIPLTGFRNEVFRLRSIFSEDGHLYLYEEHFLPTGRNMQIRFPDYHPRAFNGFPESAYLRQSFALAPNARWMVIMEQDRLVRIDMKSGKTEDIYPSATPPWHDPKRPVGIFYDHFLSPEGNVIITTGRMDSSTDPDYLWRYEIESDEWTELPRIHLLDHAKISVGPNAHILALPILPTTPQSGYREIVFIDGLTGTRLASEPDSDRAIVGNNWAACITSNYSTGTVDLVLLEINDNWKRHAITLSRTIFFNYYYHFPLAMYEPPPNGLDGMYENYVREDVD